MSFRQYVDHGWAICSLAKGEKGPRYKNWNVKSIEADAADGLAGAGLLHSLSHTMALDIDDITLATAWLAERGIDLQALLAADDCVQISSGTPNRAKLIYKMAKPLPTYQPKGSGLELRCATATGKSVHDALPPSAHPSGRIYAWAGGLLGDWRTLPPIPVPLLAAWRDLGAEQLSPDKDDPAEQPSPAVDLVKLREAAFRHSPDCEYSEWLKVGMQLHDATGGDGAGFDIFCEWSRRFKRGEYPGDLYLKTKWLSMGEAAHPATGEALLGELPAEAEDFEIIPATPAAVVNTGVSAVRKAALEALFKRFVFVIWEQEYFDADRHALIGDKAIRHMLTPYMPRKSNRLVDPVDELMRSKEKDAVEALAFHPGEQSIFAYKGKRYANTFTDRQIVPLEPMKDEQDRIDWLFNRIDDPEYRDWMLQFLAHIVQRPGIKIRTAPLLWSKTEGNGKSTIVGRIPELLVGDDYYTEVSQGELNSDHNDFLIGKWCITLAEFRIGSRGERESVNKKVENWVADTILAVHPKGTKGYSIPNHLVVTASTNKSDAALIGPENRKWAVYHFQINGADVPEMTEDEKGWLYEGFLNTERAPGVLRHYFLHYPITTFSPHASAPKNASRQDMINASSPADLELLTIAWEQRTEPFTRDVVITADVADYVRKHCTAKPSNDRIGRLLAGPPFNGTPHPFRFGKGMYRAIVLRGPWANAGGKAIWAHIQGDDVQINVDDDLLL